MYLRLSVTLASMALAASVAFAADWPQWRGPDRSGVSKETGLLKTWPKNGPPLVWTYKNAGLGFSSAAIVGDRLCTLGAIDEIEYVIALDLKGDKPSEAWKAKIGPIFTFKENVWGDGPRSTPTVEGGCVYALGGQGELVCVEITKGTVVWRKSLVKDLGGEMMSEWGYSESPLVDGDRLICTPGGAKGTVAALDKKTGAVLWRSKELTHKAPYTSAVAAEIAGVRQYVQTSYIDDIEGGVVSGIAAADGKLLWSQSFFKGMSYAIAATPIVQGSHVYVSAYATPSCRLFEIVPGDNGRFTATDVYSKKSQRVMKNNHGGVVLVGEHLFGHTQERAWVCQDFKTGAEKWSEENQLECRSGALVSADGQLYLYSDEGMVALIKATPEGWRANGRFAIPEKSKVPLTRKETSGKAKIWAHPVIANGRLYLRDQELIFCYDVREKK